MSETRICAAFGVPPIIGALRIGLEHATYSNYEAALRAFWLETLAPMYLRIADAINRHLTPEFGEDLELYFDLEEIPALQENESERVGRVREDYKGGLRTLNESRRLLGEEEVEIDYIVIPKNAKRLEAAMDPNPPEPPPSPFGNTDDDGPKPDDDVDDDDDDADEGAAGQFEILNPSTPPDGAEEMVASLTATMDRAFRALVEQTRTSVDVSALRIALEQKTREGAEGAIPIEAFEQRYADELERHLIAGAERGARMHYEHHAGPEREQHALGDLPKRIRDAILSRVKLETRRLTRELRHVVRREILKILNDAREAIDPQKILAVIGLTERQGKAIENLRAKMETQGKTERQINRAAMKYRKKLLAERAQLIAEHETRIAEKLGQRAAWERLFKEKKLRRRSYHKLWLTAEDEHVCPICEPLDRLEVPINRLFDGLWEAPPDPHPRCRCRIVLVKTRKGFRTKEVDE
jgi:rubrerythrin